MSFSFKHISVEEALERAKELCAKQEKCRQDIHKKLEEWGIEKEYAEYIINKLILEEYIDEGRYAHFFTEDHIKLHSWGKLKIEEALKQKNIPEKYIHQAWQKINNEEYRNILKSELLKKLNEQKVIKSSLLQERLINFAYSKGFEKELAQEIVLEIFNEKNIDTSNNDTYDNN